MNNKVRILVDISDIQRGFSGIVHDLVGHIKIIQSFEWVEITFLYIQFNKFNIKSEEHITREVQQFFNKEGIKFSNIFIKTRWNYFDKLLKLFQLESGKIDTSEFEYVLVQASFYFEISENSNLLVRVHDMIYISHPETISHHYLNRVFFLNTLKYLIQNPKVKLLTNSQTTSINLLKYFPEISNIQVLHCPIQPPFSGGTDIQISLESPYLVFCSTIEPKKNIIFLCEMFEEFNKSHPEYKLVIIGKKGWRYKPIVKKINTTPNVIWLQKINDNQRDQIYAKAKCFLFPSKIEGFGMPPLEAMRSRIPVLSSDIPVHREIQGECAWFGELGNKKDFIDKLEYILDEKNEREVNKKIEEGIEWVKKYDPSNMISTWVKILK